MKAWKNLASITSRFVALGILLAGCWFLLPPAKLAHGQTATMTDKGSAVETYLQTIFSTRQGVNPDQFRRKWLDLPYADRSTSQKLDIYLPEKGEGPFPVIIAIHGGSFTIGDKRDFQVVPVLRALERGYAVAAINYRLTGEARFPAQINDVKAAIRWIRAHGAQYALRPDRIALWGDSAGGNLAALAGVTGDDDALDDKNLGDAGQSSAVTAVVDWYGPIDFLTMGDPKRLEQKGNKLIGKTLLEAPESYRAASPESHIHPGVPPILMQHGDADRVIPLAQSVHFAEALRKAAGPQRVTLDVLPNADHLDERFTTSENLSKVLDFLDGHMK